MAERLSRKELYDLVWSKPRRILSSRFGISDVAPKKTCARSEIPTPERGYWAKKDAEKPAFQVAFPIRPPGMDDQVLVAAGQSHWYQDWKKEELIGRLPLPPEFPEPIEAVRERIALLRWTVGIEKTQKGPIWAPSAVCLLCWDVRLPVNLNQVTLPATNVQRSVDFYRNMGFIQIVSDLPSYARFECSEGGATFSLHQVNSVVPESGVVVYFECADLDATYSELVERGIQFDSPPTNQSWLWREARLRDPDGNVLCLFHAGENRRNPPWRLRQDATKS